MNAWLHIIGMGDNGLDSLTPATRAVLQAADVIVGGARHHALTAELSAERINWPSPFSALTKTLQKLQGKQVAVLATGDPLWYSVGPIVAKHFATSDVLFHPQVSAFQLAAARMGWSLSGVETLTVHGRPAETVLPFLAPDQKLILLTNGSETPAQIAALLAARGYGRTRMTVLAHMGGTDEARFDGLAATWAHDVPNFHSLAIDCVLDADVAPLPRVGLPDEVFVSDGTMTKRDIRAVTLTKLMPMRGALLWDIGCGSGSVAIEWMRAAKDARAIGIERRADRRAMALENAITLGAPNLRIVDGEVPDALSELDAPDAIFIGGGLSQDSFAVAWSALKPHGRLVANAVTLEGEAVLFDLFQKHGGDLTRIAISRAEPVGRLTGWRTAMPLTQWSIVKL
ncbi:MULTISPECIES: precorrin-6y C5,15-methyltransferase (decarboxylating) subunit CbiE [Pacificibacter]|uniref:precorrin-6y C5,15-methyltransferase (decarboxylating) subunit CbiE n=1 Tax=Pacificibacter TaxID=1042323 RepID=UPI001C099528|nr:MULTISPECIES: precorrin-6y C5,15-methyltransferase (decarboxylating) subunit CbiE [Pacificibacter]MBU2937334.1 precorrin-6y C5,15-methyltransferase (decarboxylating) subunit CbiE [Pacificibacter marinus]MDO6615329.1 precorrin-6y C5,15-methyltransferase (decarboxylating) subunit CbiE [Pacificibacter sp. 1_MG-2023]